MSSNSALPQELISPTMSSNLQIPQEIIDLIIDEVYSTDGIESLKAVSLVSKQWRERSQQHMFKEYHLRLFKMKKIQESNTFKTNNVSTLPQKPYTVFSAVQKLSIDAKEIAIPETSLEILQLFTNVTTLRISGWYFQKFDTHHITNLLSHFGTTVTTLELLNCCANSEVFIFLTSLFHHVSNLQVYPLASNGESFMIKPSDWPSGGARFQGKLGFGYLKAEHEDFLTFINQYSSSVHSIDIFRCENRGGLQRLFECHGGTLTSVNIFLSSEKGKLIPL